MGFFQKTVQKIKLAATQSGGGIFKKTAGFFRFAENRLKAALQLFAGGKVSGLPSSSDGASLPRAARAAHSFLRFLLSVFRSGLAGGKAFSAFVKNRITGGKRKPAPGAAGLWEDEAAFLEAVRAAHKHKEAEGRRRILTFSPFPVHGLEEAAQIQRSWIPYATFAGGLSGFLFGLFFTWYTSAESWPLIVGGKPLWSLPAFVPVIFELTVLFAALFSLAAWLFACGLPKKTAPPPLHPALTSHKFAVFIPLKPGESLDDVKGLVRDLHPQEVLEIKPD